jgi:hypothetical protein
MASKIKPTPKLKGEVARSFLDKVERESDQKIDFLKTPNLKKVAEKILADARNVKKQ